MSATTLNILLAVFLLAANGFYVAAEFALVKSRGFRIDAMAARGRFGARLTQKILKNVEAYLACCQLGITMASLGLGWVGEPTVAALLTPILTPLGMPEPALHLTAFLVGFLVFSSLHIVVGEQVPKTLAIREPEPVSLWIAYPLHISFLVFYPLNWALNNASRAILRMLGVREATNQDILTYGEIEGLVNVSAEHGNVEKTQAELIQNLFRFGELELADIMIHRTNMVAINGDDPPEKIVADVLAAPYTRLPLWRGTPENIVGVLHVKDLLRALAAVEGDVRLIDIGSLALQPWFVPDSRPLTSQLRAFLRRKTHFALVVDEYGEVMGLVTLEDILEEIVGDISDEHDVAMTGVRPHADGSVTVDGSVPIRDLNRAMEWSLPDEEATTVAGLVIHEARLIPEVGQTFTFHGYRFQVLRKNRNRITSLRVMPLTRKDAAAPGRAA
ncbi:MAG: CNNM domain-containing protein [Xanthobacteraceae bacterium]